MAPKWTIIMNAAHKSNRVRLHSVNLSRHGGGEQSSLNLLNNAWLAVDVVMWLSSHSWF